MLGSYGDLFPYLAIATELRERGHVPVAVSCPCYQELVEQQGVTCAPLRPDARPDDRALLARIMDPRRGTEAIVRQLLVPALRRSFEDLPAVVKSAEVLQGPESNHAAIR